jgi:4-hydroxymandelate oxidase
MVDDLSPPPPLAEIRSLAEYERHAAAQLPPATWRHIQEGSGTDRALRDNRDAFDRWRLLPTILADLRHGSSACHLFGRQHVAPILVAPLAYLRLAHDEGEAAAARAAAALGVGFALSTLSSIPLEEVAEASRAASAEMGVEEAPLWFQLYLQPDRDDSLTLVRRAEAAGYEAIVLTIDAAIKRSDFPLPPGIVAANLAAQPGLRHHSVPGGGTVFGTKLTDAAPTWADVEWLRSITRLPILLKGLIHGSALDRALSAGVDAIILSNHGGRILDAFPAALDILPQVLDRTNGRAPVLVDGGIRSGADVATAIALGARAVLVGRPVFHALAVGGLAGVAHMLHILRTEFELAMAQLGCATLDRLDRRHVIPAPGHG